jgi:hypothetical protein
MLLLDAVILRAAHDAHPKHVGVEREALSVSLTTMAV